MTLGFVSAILPELALDDVLETAQGIGYTGVELMCWPTGKAERRYAGVTHIDVANVFLEEARQIKERCAKYGITITGLGYYPNPLDPDHEAAEQYILHLGRVIDAAALLGVPVVNTFIGRDPHKTIDDNWPRFLEVWPPLVKHAEAKGVRIGIENCPMYFSKDEWPNGKNLAVSPAIWRRIFEAIPSDHLGLNYDPSHLVWQQMDYLAPLREFADKLFHIHAKDVRVDRDRLNQVGILATPLEYHIPKLPGLGEIDWGRFFSVLGDVGYHGPVVVEVEDRAYEDSLDSRKAALAQSLRYLKGYVS
jgi:sugar phosphate isomerase/epimerase